MMSSDQERIRERINRLLKKPGNGNCADCGVAGDFGAYRLVNSFYLLSVIPLGIFVISQPFLRCSDSEVV